MKHSRAAQSCGRTSALEQQRDAASVQSRRLDIRPLRDFHAGGSAHDIP
ncbi:hypothetical protein [Bifidobacterium sp.]